jgi:hypothetical protein
VLSFLKAAPCLRYKCRQYSVDLPPFIPGRSHSISVEGSVRSGRSNHNLPQWANPDARVSNTSSRWLYAEVCELSLDSLFFASFLLATKETSMNQRIHQSR